MMTGFAEGLEVAFPDRKFQVHLCAEEMDHAPLQKASWFKKFALSRFPGERLVDRYVILAIENPKESSGWKFPWLGFAMNLAGWN